MKSHKSLTKLACILAIPSLISPSSAAIKSLIDSGTSGTFTSGGSWSGDGTINDVDATNIGSGPVLISGFSGTGVLTMNNLESDNAESLFDPDMTLTSTYTLAGSGSANLSVTGGVDGSNAAVGRQVIELLDANTSSITLQVDFSSPLHARDTHNITGNWSAYYPWLLSASKASSPTNADFNLTLSNISTLDASYNLTSGINGTVSDSTIFNGLGTLSEIGETINLSVTNVGNRIGGTNENFIGLKRYLLTGTLPASETVDPDTQNGDGSNISIAELSNGIVSDHEQLVAQTATVVITRNGGGNFESGTEFYFTMDGYQGSDLYANVPEPGVSLLGLMAGLAFLGVRRRK